MSKRYRQNSRAMLSRRIAELEQRIQYLARQGLLTEDPDMLAAIDRELDDAHNQLVDARIRMSCG